MKILTLILLTLLCLSCSDRTEQQISNQASPQTSAQSKTQFYWDYSFGVDQFCLSSASAYVNTLPEEGPINKNLIQNWISEANNWTNEALQWTPKLQSAWDANSSILLNEVEEITGQPMKRKELTVSLFLCLNRNSMGAPLSVNIPYYLPKSSLAYKQDPWWSNQLANEDVALPLPLSAFVEMTLHETLHLYVMQLISNRKSNLLDCKYADETQSVRAHLHVFALEHEIYKRLIKKYPQNIYFQSNVLKLSKKFFKVSNAKDYTRAWEIVEQDGSSQFIDELVSQNTHSKLCTSCTNGNWHSIEWLLKLLNLNPTCSQ